MSRTSVVLLGTSGGPMPKPARAAPASALVVDDAVYLVDFGNGVGRQLTLAGHDPGQVAAGFLTHHHSDHDADLWSFFLVAWARLRTPVPVLGPAPMDTAFEAFLAQTAEDRRWRQAHSGRQPLEQLVVPRGIEPGVVHEDDRVRVTAAQVHHPPVEPAYAFRFDTDDRSVVFSGDTTPCEALVALAEGCDVLVHEVMHPDHLASSVAGSSPQAVRQHLLESHTSVHDVGGVAAATGASTLLLSHFVPADGVDDATWQSLASRGYDGEVVVGRDLLVV